jgi:hypothetical protein
LKILALYAQQTPSLLRRVKAPFGVLAERAHSFSLLHVESFTSGMTFGSDVTVLQNWELSEQEVEAFQSAVRHRVVVVDCSDPTLLDSALYRKQLAYASLVTVPNEYMRRVVHTINTNTAITPSCVDIAHFMQASKIKIDVKQPFTIGCLGPYDWHLVKDALIAVTKRHSNLMVCVGPEAARALGGPGLKGVEPQITVHNLPEIVRHCHIGLCPLDGESAIDRIWEYEYGSLCRPVIASHSKEADTWIEKIEALVTDSSRRAALGRAAFIVANENRATKRAGEYLSVYRKRLPHLFLA